MRHIYKSILVTLLVFLVPISYIGWGPCFGRWNYSAFLPSLMPYCSERHVYLINKITPVVMLEKQHLHNLHMKEYSPQDITALIQTKGVRLPLSGLCHIATQQIIRVYSQWRVSRCPRVIGQRLKGQKCLQVVWTVWHLLTHLSTFHKFTLLLFSFSLFLFFPFPFFPFSLFYFFLFFSFSGLDSLTPAH